MRQLCLGLVFTFITLVSYGQHTKSISLKYDRIAYAPKLYHISNVVDSRSNKDDIGSLNNDPLQLANGVEAGFTKLINGYVSQDKSATPVTMHITKLECNLRQRGRQWLVEVTLGIAFYYDDKQLIEFTGKGSAQGASGAADYTASLINKALRNDLESFDKWWGKNKGRVPMDKNVFMNVNISRTPDREDMLVYSLQRPLTYSDFQGPVTGSESEAAATVSGIGMHMNGETIDSRMQVNVVIYPNFNTSRSWFKREHKTPQILAHEQTHFDITGLYACKLAKLIRAGKYTQENYSKLLDEIHTANAAESVKEEDLYDTETSHGTMRSKQAMWERKVADEVRNCGCY